MIIAYTSAVANPTFSQADAEIEQATLTTTQNVYGGATDTENPTATFTFSWHLLQKPTGSNAALSAANVANVTLNSIDTWGNYRLFLIATNTATSETSETDFLKAPNSAFVHVRVNSTNLGLEKVSPGERDWHTRAWEWVSAVDTMDATVDAIDTRVTTLEGVTPGSFVGLTDTNFAGLSNGHVPVYTGTEWENQSFLGKLTYKGTYNATTGAPALTNALKGDFYIIDVAGTQFSKDFEVGDHLVVNDDMGGTLADAKVDKLDSTDAVSSVAGRTGAVTLVHTDITGLSTVANTGAYSDLTGAPTLGTAAALDTGLTTGDIPVLIDVGGNPGLGVMDGSNLTGISGGSSFSLDVFTATSSSSANANTAIWFTAVSATSCTLTLPLSSGLSDGDTVVAIRARNGELIIQQNGGDAGTLIFYGPTAASSHTLTNNNQQMTMRWNGSNWFIFDNVNALVASTGDYNDLSNKPGAASPASETVQGIIEIATNAEATAGTATDKALVPSNISSIASTQLSDTVFILRSTDIGSTVQAWDDDLDDIAGLSPTTGNAIIGDGTNWTSSALATVATSGDYNDLSNKPDGALEFGAHNDSGVALSVGQVVYINGVSGNIPTVALARANSTSTMPAYGLVKTAANAGASVDIVTFGNIANVDTTTWSLSTGDTIYVSAATAGALTSTPPSSETNLIQNIGRVVKAHASAGIIKVGGAGRSASTPNLDTDKIFLGDGSNQAVSTLLSAVNLSSFNQDLTTANVSEGTNEYFTTARVDTQVATLPMSAMLDVAYTAGHTIDNYVLTYDHSSTSWGAEPSAGGSGGGWTYNAINAASSPVTSAVSNHYGADTSSGVIAFNLPALSGLSGGEEIRIKLNTTGNNLNVTPDGSDTIDGSGTAYALSIALSSITLVASSGTNWEIV